MHSSSTASLSSLILAGGRGSRLGGRDKGLMPWRGRPIAAHLAELLRPLGQELLISCNRNQSEYLRWADRLVVDETPGYPGPLAGLLAGLEACDSDRLLVVPCDLPYLEQALLSDLLDRALTAPERPCVVRTGDDWQPLVCVLPKSALESLQDYWSCGGRAPLRWMLGQPLTVLQLPVMDQRLRNANRPEDWEVTFGA